MPFILRIRNRSPVLFILVLIIAVSGFVPVEATAGMDNSVQITQSHQDADVVAPIIAIDVGTDAEEFTATAGIADDMTALATVQEETKFTAKTDADRTALFASADKEITANGLNAIGYRSEDGLNAALAKTIEFAKTTQGYISTTEYISTTAGMTFADDATSPTGGTPFEINTLTTVLAKEALAKDDFAEKTYDATIMASGTPETIETDVLTAGAQGTTLTTVSTFTSAEQAEFVLAVFLIEPKSAQGTVMTSCPAFATGTPLVTDTLTVMNTPLIGVKSAEFATTISFVNVAETAQVMTLEQAVAGAQQAGTFDYSMVRVEPVSAIQA